MNPLKMLLYPAMLFVASTAVSQQPQQVVPNQPFSALHVMTITPAQEKSYIAAIEDINGIIARAGCSTCGYHLYKISDPGQGAHNYVQISNWPGRDVYTKIHDSKDFQAAYKQHASVIDPIFKSEEYYRIVEVKTRK